MLGYTRLRALPSDARLRRKLKTTSKVNPKLADDDGRVNIQNGIRRRGRARERDDEDDVERVPTPTTTGGRKRELDEDGYIVIIDSEDEPNNLSRLKFRFKQHINKGEGLVTLEEERKREAVRAKRNKLLESLSGKDRRPPKRVG
ncbi:hypothetical protein QBC39DRAFT_334978 [Podospora conica]|nr:hypothetical protein QBC39DRAFT_334978 [Schizothecium conicum]